MPSSASDYLKDLVGADVTITSGDRTPQHNRLVGGAPNSAHLKPGQAYDFLPAGISTSEAANRIAKSGRPFDQVYDEGDHVHVSFASTNRRQVIPPKMAGPSDSDILAALTGKVASASAAPTSPQGGPSDDQLIAALTGGAKSSASPTGSPKPSDGKPNYMGRPFGFTQEMESHIPFAKDIAAGTPALLDTMFGPQRTLSDLITEHPKTLGDRYRSNLAEYNQAQSEYETQNPGRSTLGTGLGILASGGPARGAISAGTQTLGQLMKSGAKGGATLGALFGVGEASPSLDERAGNAAKGAATGATVGGALPVVGAVVKPVARALGATAAALAEKLGITNPDQKKKAENLLLKAMERDQTSAKEIATALGGSEGKPLTAMDVGGTNLKRQARNLITQPGEAGDKVTKFLGERSENQAGRVLGDIKSHLSSNTDVYGVADKLIKERSAAAGPLYKAAQAADSTAPFESQYRKALVEATGAKGQIAKQIKAIEAEKSGALAARGAAGSETRAKYMALQEDLKDAESARQSAERVFQKAKADGTANTPGATWSPRLQEFLDNPEIQSGLKSGLKLEKQDAITEGRAFKDKDYSILGMDEKGEPILGAVPTMKSLMVAKEALDARIPEMIDPNTRQLTKAGRSLKNFRDGFVKELDALNPRYAPAREAWSGPSQSHAAIRKGQDFLKADVEEIQREMKGMSASDRDFYRVGAARSLQERAKSASDSTDLSKRLFGNQEIREQIDATFGKGAADKFAKSMGAESEMAHTGRFVLGGPNTANKFADAEDSHLELAQDMMHGMMHGGPKGAVALGTYGALKRGVNNLFTGMNPQIANHLAEALTAQGPGATKLYEELAAAQAARSARSAGKKQIGQGVNRLLAGAAAQSAVRSNPQ